MKCVTYEDKDKNNCRGTEVIKRLLGISYICASKSHRIKTDAILKSDNDLGI